jgi:ubiquinone/menaquinone biosynthesis C-methylase UbiE
MLARAPGSFPRTVSDLIHLGFAPATFDIVVMAFVLFHLQDPLQALCEARRVLRPGGALGTITWDGEPRFPAQSAWVEELDSHGAAASDPSFVNYEPVGSPAKMRGLLEAAGFDVVRAWSAPFDHEYRREEFIAIRTTRGMSRRRFESLDEERRSSFLRRVRERLSTMRRSDFVDRSTLIYTTATRR